MKTEYKAIALILLTSLVFSGCKKTPEEKPKEKVVIEQTEISATEDDTDKDDAEQFVTKEPGAMNKLLRLTQQVKAQTRLPIEMESFFLNDIYLNQTGDVPILQYDYELKESEEANLSERLISEIDQDLDSGSGKALCDNAPMKLAFKNDIPIFYSFKDKNDDIVFEYEIKLAKYCVNEEASEEDIFN